MYTPQNPVCILAFASLVPEEFSVCIFANLCIVAAFTASVYTQCVPHNFHVIFQGQQSINPYQLYYTNTNIDPDGIGDSYIPYNKPYGVMSWLQDVNPAGDYFLIVDADMTFHRYKLLSFCGKLKHGP